MSRVRTRYAPSPTGRMHVGNLRTALYAYLIAKHEGGDFLLRIEDTDQERFVEGAVEIIYQTLKDTGLIHDEGPDKDGGCGPYVQSERQASGIYLEYAKKLVEKGIPREEIAFIHEAGTEAKKAELFAKVRAGQVRILLGSTPKLGAGTNIQDRLIALHHLDCPWKPSDLEQQEGRILRQGNQNEKVKIFRYVTENTFDAYMWVRHEVA